MQTTVDKLSSISDELKECLHNLGKIIENLKSRRREEIQRKRGKIQAQLEAFGELKNFAETNDKARFFLPQIRDCCGIAILNPNPNPHPSSSSSSSPSSPSLSSPSSSPPPTLSSSLLLFVTTPQGN